MVVLDDLHRVAPDSIGVLRLLLAELRHLPLLVVATLASHRHRSEQPPHESSSEH